MNGLMYLNENGNIGERTDLRRKCRANYEICVRHGGEGKRQQRRDPESIYLQPSLGNSVSKTHMICREIYFLIIICGFLTWKGLATKLISVQDLSAEHSFSEFPVTK